MTSVSTIVVGDTETTDLEPAEGAALLEVALLPLHATQGSAPDQQLWTTGEPLQWFVEHTGPIPAVSRAVHHIRPDQVAPGAPNCHGRGAVLHEILSAEEPGDMMYAFHNAPFDMKFLPELTCPVIDTLQCARHIYPDAPRYGNQVLRYHLGLEPEERLLSEYDEKRGVGNIVPLAPHRAQYDVAVTAELVRHMLRTHTPEELLVLSTTPILLEICEFKKYRGVPWREVPRDYLRWMTREGVGRDDPNLWHTVQHYLAA